MSWLRADEPLGRAYWAHHNSAANYAVANRHLIVQRIDEALSEVFGVESEVYYEISHNLVQEETFVLNDVDNRRSQWAIQNSSSDGVTSSSTFI